MTVLAVEGPAGSGKTVHLIHEVEAEIRRNPLPPDSRILALTFMHGARHRMEERISHVRSLVRSVDCMTIDSFAWRLLKRWRTLAAALGHQVQFRGDFDADCNVAGALLERTDVGHWVASTYPIVVIDEGQDLRPERIRMVAALSGHVRLVLVAADEFQCLDQTLRPNPLMEWLPTVCQPLRLSIVRRTSVPQLLRAAQTIRDGGVPTAGGAFRILAAPSVPMAAATLAAAIAWHPTGSVAVITASLQGDFARNVVARVATMPCGTRRLGPFSVNWEKTSVAEVQELGNQIPGGEILAAGDAREALERVPPTRVTKALISWINSQQFEFGKLEINRTDLLERARRVSDMAVSFRQYMHRLHAMTIAQAKNREFAGVVVIWPYQVGGTDEQRRRLLYNSITRAKDWCTVIVQGAQLPNRSPFR